MRSSTSSAPRIAMTGDRSLFYCSQSLSAYFYDKHTTSDHRGFLVFREVETALSTLSLQPPLQKPLPPCHSTRGAPIAANAFLLLTGAMYRKRKKKKKRRRIEGSPTGSVLSVLCLRFMSHVTLSISIQDRYRSAVRQRNKHQRSLFFV